MDGFTAYPTKSFTPNTYIGAGGIALNGTSSPVTASNIGSMKNYFVTTYSATGVLTVTFDAGLAFPNTPVIVVGTQSTDQSTNSYVATLRSWTNSTRVMIIQLETPNTTTFQAVAPPSAAATNYVHFMIEIVNSTGK